MSNHNMGTEVKMKCSLPQLPPVQTPQFSGGKLASISRRIKERQLFLAGEAPPQLNLDLRSLPGSAELHASNTENTAASKIVNDVLFSSVVDTSAPLETEEDAANKDKKASIVCSEKIQFHQQICNETTEKMRKLPFIVKLGIRHVDGEKIDKIAFIDEFKSEPSTISEDEQCENIADEEEVDEILEDVEGEEEVDEIGNEEEDEEEVDDEDNEEEEEEYDDEEAEGEENDEEEALEDEAEVNAEDEVKVEGEAEVKFDYQDEIILENEEEVKVDDMEVEAEDEQEVQVEDEEMEEEEEENEAEEEDAGFIKGKAAVVKEGKEKERDEIKFPGGGNNWIEKHAQYMSCLAKAKRTMKRYALGKFPGLPPPPGPNELDIDYLQCPNCLRRFAENYNASIHLSKCSNKTNLIR